MESNLILFGIDPEEGWIMMSRIEGRSLAQVLQEDSDHQVEYKLARGHQGNPFNWHIAW